jgi:hypothetical protein
MSADPMRGNVMAPQSLNRFSYVANDPVNLIDPLGLWGEPDDVDSSTNTITGHGPCIATVVDQGPGTGLTPAWRRRWASRWRRRLKKAKEKDVP